MDFVYPVILFFILLASASLGWAGQRKLHARHISRDSVDSVRLLIGMLLTFSAIVLGLLTSSAKQRFDGLNADLSALGTDLIELDQRLRIYGPEADPIRELLRRYTAAALFDTWPDEPEPKGEYPRFAAGPDRNGVEGMALGDMLSSVDVRIEHLEPQTDYQRQIAARLRDRMAEVIQQRWRLIFSARSTISWPFLVILTSWLAIIFATFGLTATRNSLVYAVVVLSALSIASPLYLIIDYSDALTGLEQLSSAPMRAALVHMDRAN
jgi:hypothetical protein